MHRLKDTTTRENYIIHVCYECDPDWYPNGKPILPSDKLAEPNEKGEWVCGECQIEAFKRKMMTVNVGIVMSNELIRIWERD